MTGLRSSPPLMKRSLAFSKTMSRLGMKTRMMKTMTMTPIMMMLMRMVTMVSSSSGELCNASKLTSEFSN